MKTAQSPHTIRPLLALGAALSILLLGGNALAQKGEQQGAPVAPAAGIRAGRKQ